MFTVKGNGGVAGDLKAGRTLGSEEMGHSRGVPSAPPLAVFLSSTRLPALPFHKEEILYSVLKGRVSMESANNLVILFKFPNHHTPDPEVYVPLPFPCLSLWGLDSRISVDNKIKVPKYKVTYIKYAVFVRGT